MEGLPPASLGYVGERLRPGERGANLSAGTRSVLNLYRAMIKLRKVAPELVAGSYAPAAATSDLLAYRREYEDTAFLEPGSHRRDRIGRSGSARRRRPDRTAEVIVRYSG